MPTPDQPLRRASFDEAQLERLFEQARRYPLLSPDQEREIDASKWQAASRARDALLCSRAGRALLCAVAREALERPPRIEQFALREHHFLLRRELGGGTSGNGEVDGAPLDPLAALSRPGVGEHPELLR
ncbi:MAG: hypothetical protein ACK2U9_02995, partial [Anaerolineae bacterium]